MLTALAGEFCAIGLVPPPLLVILVVLLLVMMVLLLGLVGLAGAYPTAPGLCVLLPGLDPGTS